MSENFIRPKELAEWLNVNEMYIHKFHKQGVFSYVLIDGINYIPVGEIETWINDNTINCNIEAMIPSSIQTT